MRNFLIFFITFFSISHIYGQADTVKVKPTQRKYSLFNPVPKAEMKEMATDRPDATETAYTVEAGHFQMESDLFKHVRNKANQVLSTSNIFNLANYKLGLTEKMDLQLAIPVYVCNRIRNLNTGKIIQKTAGFDDITLRVKYNLWGNAGGKTAFALLPFLSFPTSSFAHNELQGGVIFPFALSLNKGLNFGTQAGLEIVKEADNAYHSNIVYSFTFGKPVNAVFNVFAEAFTSYNTYSKETGIYANAGIIYSISPNFNIDAGINYGINKEREKIIFSGFSYRL
ncbi:MAG: transporter [Ferruginibacter sp.]